jgi:hypothetical protein
MVSFLLILLKETHRESIGIEAIARSDARTVLRETAVQSWILWRSPDRTHGCGRNSMQKRKTLCCERERVANSVKKGISVSDPICMWYSYGGTIQRPVEVTSWDRRGCCGLFLFCAV